MNRIEEKFKQLGKEGKKAFIAFVTAGYPDLSTTLRLVKEFEKKGVDLVELGVPFSDPLADGPAIQEASQFSLKKGVNLLKILELVKNIRRAGVSIPVCLMTYYNPVFRFGEKRFVDDALKNGVDGVIIPDLPPEEAKEFIRYADKKNLLNINFIAPTSSDNRIRQISKSARGFIYYVSLTGVTGSRSSLSSDLKDNLSKIKKLIRKPVCVGFGISNAQQVAQVCKISDGVIVGSAIIEKIKKHIGDADLAEKVARFAQKLKCTKEMI